MNANPNYFKTFQEHVVVKKEHIIMNLQFYGQLFVIQIFKRRFMVKLPELDL
jgi:hypothetical protein